MQRCWWKVIGGRCGGKGAIDDMADCAAAAAPLSSPAPLAHRCAAGGLTAALRPSFWHSCRSTAQWIAWNWLSRARDLLGIGRSGHRQFGRHLNLHIAVLQLPFIVLLEQYRANQPNDGGLIGEDADDVGAPLDLLIEPLERVGAVNLLRCCSGKSR